MVLSSSDDVELKILLSTQSGFWPDFFNLKKSDKPINENRLRNRCLFVEGKLIKVGRWLMLFDGISFLRQGCFLVHFKVYIQLLIA